MCDQTEIEYLDGDVVWVKLGSCWWPGEVVGPDRLPPDVLPSFRKPPIAVVKFFQESSYEYVKNTNSIYKYNCSRKNEFINKGLYMYRTKHGHMEKFPEDVIRAETAVGGDIEILTRDEFQEVKKESYKGIFGDTPKKVLGSVTKRGRGRGRPSESPKVATPIRKTFKEKSDYKVHILLQSSKDKEPQRKSTESASTPSTSRAGSEPSEEKTPQKQEAPASSLTPASGTGGIYACHSCSFSTSRLNVLILHNKSHSATYTPYVPTPVRKKQSPKSAKSTPKSSKVVKTPRPRKEKPEKVKKSGKKRPAEDEPVEDIKKPKTEQEIKSSLLADWDDGDEESEDEPPATVTRDSPELPAGAESPAVPTSAELPEPPSEVNSHTDKKDEAQEKPESSSDSKYEFCEDEEWHVETDAGRKIPRVKNSKRKDDTKSLSVDDDDVAREVAELLTKTSVPELPSIPEPLKAEENFPEPPVVKCPDKSPNSEQNQTSEKAPDVKPTKAIFKTKTFFRSRHSRSQDVIGKYVAEQLNAAERMDMSETDLNGSEVVSSPEARESPVEHIKVARLAPKIQLKKMKAEAAQQREKDKYEHPLEEPLATEISNIKESDELDVNLQVNEKSNLDVLYPTREIKPVNKDSPIKLNKEDNNRLASPVSVIDTPISTIGLEIIPKPQSQVYLSPKNAKNLKKSEIVQEFMPQDSGIIVEDVNSVKSAEKVILNATLSDTPIVPAVETTPKKSYGQSRFHKSINEFSTDHFSTESQIKEISTPKPFAKLNEFSMSESTASAVDALLSVSRETDRVPRVVSDDLPEDLFEDDNKDGSNSNDASTANNNNADLEPNEISTKKEQLDLNNDLNGVNINHKMVVDNNIPNNDAELLPKEQNVILDNTAENIPSESDLQIAETLLNLPATALQNQQCPEPSVCITTEETVEEEVVTTNDNVLLDNKVYESIEQEVCTTETVIEESPETDDGLNVRYETELEKNENLNAAQSLVQMSEFVDPKVNIVEANIVNEDTVGNTFKSKQNNGVENTVQQNVAMLSSDNINPPIAKVAKYETTTSKLLQILEEPPQKILPITKPSPAKQIVVSGNEKILNFDVAKTSLKGKSPVQKQQIIIRRAVSSKASLNNLNDVITSPDKIILSRNSSPKDGSSVQTFTIKPSLDSHVVTDPKKLIIQPKLRKITKSKYQKIRPQNSLIAPAKEMKNLNETPMPEESIFDINSMPVVLSDDILTPESIEKMPIVMSDGNIITNPPNPPKLIKSKPTIIENEKVAIPSKTEVKTLLVTQQNTDNKVTTTPNILSKSSKIRGTKPMLVFNKTTGKQKIIMTKAEPTMKEIKPATTLIKQVPQPTNKTEKYILLPTQNSPRAGRTQKIVIDPQTGKAHVLVTKGQEQHMVVPENKPVSAKLIPSSADSSNPGTVMIITNAQGAQSRIVLTPEHEKILFPNKQQANVSQLKAITQRIPINSGVVQKTIVTTSAPAKAPTRIVPKQIITSKGQLIVGGRVTSTSQNMSPVPEIRPAPPKRILPAEPKKLVQAVQKNSSEPLILLQPKGTLMQLTAAQFEHLQRTGQIVQKPTPIPENKKIVVQKSITITPKDALTPIAHKPRARKVISESTTPAKRVKHQEILISPAPMISAPLPPLTSLSNTVHSVPPKFTHSTIVPTVSNTVSISTTPSYTALENFEELLPSTAIVRQPHAEPPRAPTPPPAFVPPVLPPPPEPEPEPVVEPEPVPESPPAQLSEGQLLAVPGENFGGPPDTFYLCVQDNGTLTPIDNRPLVLENNQLVPMAVEQIPVFPAQPERRDILEAALANSDVFHADVLRDDAPDFRDLNANVSVHCRVSETSTTLNQPIMTPVEVPSKGDSEPAVATNLEDGLAVIGVTPHSVPTSLELPITVTDPRIAPRTTDPLSASAYTATLIPSPTAEMFVAAEEAVTGGCGGPISMPLLSDEDAGGKSMPILTEQLSVDDFVPHA